MIRVPQDYPTITEALANVQENGVIELDDGIYVVGKHFHELEGIKLDESVPANITIRSRSGNPAKCIIDCKGDYRVGKGRGFTFWHRNEIESTDKVEGIRITGGRSIRDLNPDRIRRAGGGGALIRNSRVDAPVKRLLLAL